MFSRQSGILMHISSLPSPGGIGTLGKEACEFADFLHDSGMNVWQVLPIGPTGYGESPYQSSSTFAGNPLLISISSLVEEGLLSHVQMTREPEDSDEVPFDQVREHKTKLLKQCWLESGKKLLHEVECFQMDNPWVRDFALFTALKEKYGQKKWTEWPDRDVKFREPLALARCRIELASEMEYHIFVQYLFRKQWFALKTYCNNLGILLFGDMPIYVAEDSADAWTHPEVFQLDRDLIPKRVAGVPPDYFSEDGQLWGNPLYRWKWLRLHGYRWWIERMKGMASLFDMIRVDHFIGFANYYSIPHGAPNARNGKWVNGPDRHLFKKMRKALPNLKLISEDLGCVTPRVRKLLNWCGYPGMRVMCFGFGSGHDNPHYPDQYPENAVAYTGTHDNDTIIGYLNSSDEKTLKDARETLEFEKIEDAPSAFIRRLFESKCNLVMVPMQDLLELGGEARMNLPGTSGGNWKWRMLPGQLTKELSTRIMKLNQETHRGEDANEQC